MVLRTPLTQPKARGWKYLDGGGADCLFAFRLNHLRALLAVGGLIQDRIRGRFPPSYSIFFLLCCFSRGCGEETPNRYPYFARNFPRSHSDLAATVPMRNCRTGRVTFEWVHRKANLGWGESSFRRVDWASGPIS
jgi:hypothetical protein